LTRTTLCSLDSRATSICSLGLPTRLIHQSFCLMKPESQERCLTHFSEWLRHEAEEEKAIVQLSGIAGWLLFPALGTLLTPLWFLKDIIEGVSIISNVTGPINKDAVLNLAFALAVDIAFVAGWIVAIVFLFKHKRVFPKLFIGLTVAMLLNNVAGIFLGDTPLPDDRILVIARPVITLAIWGTYLLVSKRSRSTFVN
jgi:hypothetical protein